MATMNAFEPRIDPHAVRKGEILISEPLLVDMNFCRSVVLLVEHTSTESVGFVLNRAVGKSLSDVVEGFDSVDLPLYVGGPVEPDTLHFVHAIGAHVPNTQKVTDGLFWGGDLDYIRQLAAAQLLDPQSIRFFLGYAGWGPAQLETEMADRSWVACSVKPAAALSFSDADMWEQCVAHLGGKFRVWLNYPVDPILN